ncbi:MAG: PAS domain S-box protein [Balneolaceae bacterium]
MTNHKIEDLYNNNGESDGGYEGMDTLLVGNENESRQLLEDALKLRRHNITTVTPEELSPKHLVHESVTLIIFYDVTNEAIRKSREIRALDLHDNLALIAILNRETIDRFHEILDAGFDQCIVESLYDEQRLDIRLAFAEKLARDKIKRSITEQKLRESEGRYRSIVETTVDAIITINDRGLIRTFNRSAEELFQFRDSEVIGKNVHILMPKPYKEEHDDYIRNYLSTGRRKIIGIGREVTGRRKDGTTFPMYLAVSEVRIRNQRIFTGIIRDISEQRRLELEILQTSEHERRRIGQDLHDGLGQMLTGIGLMAKNLTHALEKQENPHKESAREITDLIREADQHARELARGLVPVNYDSEGLHAALERLAGRAETLFRIQCRYQSSGEVQFEDANHVTHIYRIAQEAVSNAVKHGGAEKVQIHLSGSADRIRLRVEDDGKGFEEDWDEKGGLGVRIMQFRAGLIGATIDITDSTLGGASIICTIHHPNHTDGT